jgi:hypothetical protein
MGKSTMKAKCLDLVGDLADGLWDHRARVLRSQIEMSP